ncbi:PIG-L deacetylase family protein [Pseudomonadota bacterium]
MIDLKFDKVLVVAAHPDDEVLGCGGTMARLAASGCEVHIVILGEGLTSRGGAGDPAALEKLHNQGRQACDRVGGCGVRFCGLPDNKFDDTPLLNIVQLVEAELCEIKPQAVFTHHPGDLNIDHRITHQAVVTATRPTGTGPGQGVQLLCAFEVPSASEWAFSQFAPFRPNMFVDISTTLETKIEALACYVGEQCAFPHPRSAEHLRALAQMRGSSVGSTAAEAFELIRTFS